MKKKNHKSWIFDKKTKRTEQTVFVKKITQKVSDMRFMCNINYMWILQLPNMDGSVEDPEIKICYKLCCKNKYILFQFVKLSFKLY